MNNEIQAAIEYLEKERQLDRHMLVEALESALMNASRKSVLGYNDLRVEINPNTFKLRTFAQMTVVDKVEDPQTEIALWKAQERDADIQLGDEIETEVMPKNFGRIAAQTAKQTIMHRLRQAEKDKVRHEFEGRRGDVVSGRIVRFDRGDIIVDLGITEGRLPSRERIPTAEYQQGERLRAFILSTENHIGNPEIILSRSHPDFVRKLLEIEVTEIADGTVEIKGIAREAGYRSKVAVFSADDKIDPVGACVGMKGIRVKNIVRELNGEKIDIVRWHEDIKTYVANALVPARLKKIEVDDLTHTVNVIVDNDQLSLAIGKKGQNARLTAKLTGWKIEVDKDEREMNFEELVTRAIRTLSSIDGITEQQAEILVQAGYSNLEGLLTAELDHLAEIEELDREDALSIKKAVEAFDDRGHGKIEI